LGFGPKGGPEKAAAKKPDSPGSRGHRRWRIERGGTMTRQEENKPGGMFSANKTKKKNRKNPITYATLDVQRDGDPARGREKKIGCYSH